MAYRGEAYDYSTFEDYSSYSDNRVPDDFREFSDYNETYGAVVPQPEIEDEPGWVVDLPRREPEKRPRHQAKRKHNPLKVLGGMFSFTFIFVLLLALVHSHVVLTELGDDINKASTALEEAESLEVQLTMKAAALMTDAQVEAYAVQQLGMGKLTGSQVVYLHVAQQDRGTVVQDIEGKSWIDQLMAKLRAWTS